MPCELSKLSHAFCVQGSDEWAMWAYGDNCSVAAMLEPDFFNPAHSLLRVGGPDHHGQRAEKGRAGLAVPVGWGRKVLPIVASVEKARVKLRVLVDFGGRGMRICRRVRRWGRWCRD